MSVEISILVAVIGCGLSVGTFFIGRVTAAKTSGQQNGQMLSDLGYIRRGIDGLERKMERIERQYTDLEVRLSKLEEVVKIYHKEGV